MPPTNRLAVETSEFWDERDLLTEELREFNVCHGCRLCFNFCPAFPSMFEKTEALEDGTVKELTRSDLRMVEDERYQCKLCYVRFPYIPPHQLALDIPRLLMRAKFVNRKKEGVPLAARILADTDFSGRVGTMSAPFANAGNRMAPVRFVLNKTLGLHPKANLPKFATRTFAAWFKQNEKRLQ